MGNSSGAYEVNHERTVYSAVYLYIIKEITESGRVKQQKIILKKATSVQEKKAKLPCYY